MSNPQDFRAACFDAAQAFVRSAVVVDDLPAEAAMVHDVPESLTLPTRPPIGGETRQQQTDLEEDAEPVPDPHVLRQHELVDGFADLRVVCSVIKTPGALGTPEEEALLRERILKIARSADLLILDWSRKNDAGKYTCSIIKALIREPNRRRLVIIYTGSSSEDLANIIGSLRAADPTLNDDPQLPCTMKSAASGIAITLLQKPHAEREFYESSRTREGDLPKKALALFGELTGGLLANVAMHGLGMLRDGTHDILAAFGPTLDGGYVVHRARTMPVADAEEQIESLLSEAVLDQFRHRGLRRHVGAESVRLWFGTEGGRKLRDEFVKHGGHSEEALVTGEGFKNQKKKLKDDQAGQNQFARLVYCGTPGSKVSLSIGTVLRRQVENGPDEYVVCVMPACDTQRVPAEGQRFLFARAMARKTRGARHVRVPGVMLAVLTKATELRTYGFAGGASGNEPVFGEEKDGAIRFTSKCGKAFDYVANLRPMIAQDIVTQIGSNLGRVGLMEAEFIRELSK